MINQEVTPAEMSKIKSKVFGDDFQHNKKWYRRGEITSQGIKALPITHKGGRQKSNIVLFKVKGEEQS